MHASGLSALHTLDSVAAVLFIMLVSLWCARCSGFCMQQNTEDACALHCCGHTSLKQTTACRSTCDFVAGRLQDADIEAAAYHAGLPGAARSRVQQDWSEVRGLQARLQSSVAAGTLVYFSPPGAQQCHASAWCTAADASPQFLCCRALGAALIGCLVQGNAVHSCRAAPT